MKNLSLIVVACLVFNVMQANIYFWESYRDGERSCCLFLNGADICNPHVPCTRNAAYDLTGIFDYISRILQVDKGSSYPYHKVLDQAQHFIRHALTSGMRMYYRYDESARAVKFFHEIAETTKAHEKSSKGSAASTAAVEKQKGEDAVLAYLIKIGLARPLR